MKILFVTPCVPTKTDGRRPYNFIKYLSKQHKIHLAALILPNQQPSDIRRIQNLGVQVTSIEVAPSRSMLNCLFGLPLARPLRVSWCQYQDMRNAIEMILEKDHYDIIHVDRMRMGQYARGLQPKKVIDFTDSLLLYLERSRPVRRRCGERCVDWWESRVIPAYERKLLRYADASIVCSDVDAQIFHQTHPGSSFEVVENGVDLTQFTPKTHDPNHFPRCIITGTLFYFPNIDSVLYYTEKCLPCIRKTYPEMETLVLGTRPSREIQKLDGKMGVQVYPDIPRMEDWLYSDDIYLCPLRVGAGVRNKLMEAMAVGMPIVTTPLGPEGMNVKHEKEMLFAETPEEFEQQITRLIESPDLRRSLSENALNYVRDHHDLEIVGAKLERLYESLL